VAVEVDNDFDALAQFFDLALSRCGVREDRGLAVVGAESGALDKGSLEVHDDRVGAPHDVGRAAVVDAR
jgi:hypothetical protein